MNEITLNELAEIDISDLSILKGTWIRPYLWAEAFCSDTIYKQIVLQSYLDKFMLDFLACKTVMLDHTSFFRGGGFGGFFCLFYQ